MKDRVIESWAEIVHFPRGRSGQGQPEWQTVIRGRTERGLLVSKWIGSSVSRDRAFIIARTKQWAAEIGLELRSADVIPFSRGRAA